MRIRVQKQRSFGPFHRRRARFYFALTSQPCSSGLPKTAHRSSFSEFQFLANLVNERDAHLDRRAAFLTPAG